MRMCVTCVPLVIVLKFIRGSLGVSRICVGSRLGRHLRLSLSAGVPSARRAHLHDPCCHHIRRCLALSPMCGDSCRQRSLCAAGSPHSAALGLDAPFPGLRPVVFTLPMVSMWRSLYKLLARSGSGTILHAWHLRALSPACPRHRDAVAHKASEQLSSKFDAERPPGWSHLLPESVQTCVKSHTPAVKSCGRPRGACPARSCCKWFMPAPIGAIRRGYPASGAIGSKHLADRPFPSELLQSKGANCAIGVAMIAPSLVAANCC